MRWRGVRKVEGRRRRDRSKNVWRLRCALGGEREGRSDERVNEGRGGERVDEYNRGGSVWREVLLSLSIGLVADKVHSNFSLQTLDLLHSPVSLRTSIFTTTPRSTRTLARTLLNLILPHSFVPLGPTSSAPPPQVPQPSSSLSLTSSSNSSSLLSPTPEQLSTPPPPSLPLHVPFFPPLNFIYLPRSLPFPLFPFLSTTPHLSHLFTSSLLPSSLPTRSPIHPPPSSPP